MKFKFLPLLVLPMIFTGCGGGTSTTATEGGAEFSGTINIDGSSTVQPVTSAMAEEFQELHPRVNVVVRTSGTGGGFKRFTIGETDISNASRPILSEELAIAQQNGVEFIELPICYDGLSVVVSKNNTFVDYLTVEELKKIWEKDSKVQNWSDIRPEWPNKKIQLFGPGLDSGTFDYFCEAVLHTKKESRMDFQASEDDNFLVTGVAGSEFALGYFGYAYYEENKDKLRVVPIDNGNGPIAPSDATIADGTYQPLSRPLFIYINTKAAERPEVKAFVEFYLSDKAPAIIRETGYFPLPQNMYPLVYERFTNKIKGSIFKGTPDVGVKIEDLLKMESGK